MQVQTCWPMIFTTVPMVRDQTRLSMTSQSRCVRTRPSLMCRLRTNPHLCRRCLCQEVLHPCHLRRHPYRCSLPPSLDALLGNSPLHLGHPRGTGKLLSTMCHEPTRPSSLHLSPLSFPRRLHQRALLLRHLCRHPLRWLLLFMPQSGHSSRSPPPTPRSPPLTP